MLRIFVALYFITNSVFVTAENCINGPLRGIFYQPLTVDLKLSSTDWQKRFRRLNGSGFSRIYLQWTAYGEVDFVPAVTSDEQDFLIVLSNAAKESHIQLHVGLMADPEWFDLSRQTGDDLVHYLAGLRKRSIKQAKEIIETYPDIEISGWYLSEEINDRDWINPEARQELYLHLQLMVSELQKLTPNFQVTVSGYAGGVMSAQEYSALWQYLLEIDGLKFLQQDGRGTRALALGERNQYLQALHSTLKESDWGVIAELFRQQKSVDDTFISQPAQIASLVEQLTRRQSLSKTRLLIGFSLRYLFEHDSLLLNDYYNVFCNHHLMN